MCLPGKHVLFINRSITINNNYMAEEFIDFDNSGRKILINPVVPLQIINIYARSGQRVQATLLGRVYTSAI